MSGHMGFNMRSAKAMAQSFSKPFGVTAPSASGLTRSAKAERPEPEAKKSCVDERDATLPPALLLDLPAPHDYPTPDPLDMTPWDYLTALQECERICMRKPIELSKYKGFNEERALAAPVLLLQMQDTLASTSRLLKWLKAKFGPQVFEHTDQPVGQFLSVVRTARTFIETSMTTAMPVAVFFYPTTFAIDELIKLLPLPKVRLVVVLDDVFIPAVVPLRRVAKTEMAFVEKIEKSDMIAMYDSLRKTWSFHAGHADFWRERTGLDPRMMLNWLYFEHLKQQAPMSFDADLNWDWFHWVNSWCRFGARTLLELTFVGRHSKEGLMVNVTGVLAKKETVDELSLLAWDCVSPTLRQQATHCKQLELNMADVDTSMALKYLHFIAPKVFTFFYDVVPMQTMLGCADALAMLSHADLQQSKFEPQINLMHQQAVHYGMRRIRARHDFELKADGFYEFMLRQRTKPAVIPTCEFAPVVVLHAKETLPRLLFLADPDGQVAFWPTPAGSLDEYAAQWTDYVAQQAAGNHYFEPEQEMAWRLVLGWLAAQDEPVPKRPAMTNYREKAAVEVLQCKHAVMSHFCYCLECDQLPDEPILHCAAYCRGKWSCMVCRTYNQHIARLVTRGRALEKI